MRGGGITHPWRSSVTNVHTASLTLIYECGPHSIDSPVHNAWFVSPRPLVPLARLPLTLTALSLIAGSWSWTRLTGC